MAQQTPVTLKVPGVPKVPNVPGGWCLVLVPVLVLGGTVNAQSPFSSVVESAVDHGTQIKGLVALDAEGKPVSKRFVLRIPASRWHGSLVIGAHGGGSAPMALHGRECGGHSRATANRGRNRHRPCPRSDD